MKILASFAVFLILLTGSAAAQEPSPAPVVTATAAPTPAVDADATPWSTGTYTYDGSGNITAIGSDTYRYDAYGRLTKSVIGGVAETHTYDRYGNITSITTAGQTTTLSPVPATNRVPEPGTTSGNVYATHDTAGRVTSFPGGTFEYDPLDAVVYTTVGGEKIHLYTASDERIATIAVESPTSSRPTWTMKGSDWTLRDPNGQVLTRFKRTAAGAWSWDEDYIYRDGQLLAAEVATEHRTLHFHSDHLGTPRLITNHMGAKVAFHSYAPFGIERTSPAQDTETRKFTGHERDASNLDYMHARYYLPGWGRFLSVDPLLNLKKAMTQPQNWNRYAYVMNNPINRIDPDGRDDGMVGLTVLQDCQLNNCRPNVEQDHRIAAVGMSLMPYIGAAYSFLSAAAGKDLITGEAITGGWRMAGVFLPVLAKDEVFRQAVANGPELVQGFRIFGNKGMVGETFSRNIFLIEAAKKGGVALPKLTAALESEARAAGAKTLRIVGHAVLNKGFMNEKVAKRLGYTFRRINDDTVEFVKQLQ